MKLTATLLTVETGAETTIEAYNPLDFINMILEHFDSTKVITEITRDTTEEQLGECMDIVMNTTSPGEEMDFERAGAIISQLEADEWDLPEILTPQLFVELYNDLESNEEEE